VEFHEQMHSNRIDWIEHMEDDMAELTRYRVEVEAQAFLAFSPAIKEQHAEVMSAIGIGLLIDCYTTLPQGEDVKEGMISVEYFEPSSRKYLHAVVSRESIKGVLPQR